MVVINFVFIIFLGPIQDRGILSIDGNQIGVILNAQNFSYTIDPTDWIAKANLNDDVDHQSHTIDMLVENQRHCIRHQVGWFHLEQLYHFFT